VLVVGRFHVLLSLLKKELVENDPSIFLKKKKDNDPSINIMTNPGVVNQHRNTVRAPNGPTIELLKTGRAMLMVFFIGRNIPIFPIYPVYP
jgi:hypothetical protein